MMKGAIMKPIIEADNVTKVYGYGENSVIAVKEASFKVFPGEFVALVGPSGSGKTTMLAMLAAMLNPTNGKVVIDGMDLCCMKEGERVKFRRKNIGFTFQSNNLIPYLTVLENVELMLRLNRQLNRVEHDRVKQLLVNLGLGEKLNVLPNQISGGQRQRVAIARSVAHQPRVVLADEPTANLDTQRARQVVEIFADLIHHQERCGIMVTHDLRMCRYVDKVFQMEDGKLIRVIDDKAAIEQFAREH